MTLTNSQGFDINGFLKSLAKNVWENEGLQGTHIQPTLEDLQSLTVATPMSDPHLSVSTDGEEYRVTVWKEGETKILFHGDCPDHIEGAARLEQKVSKKGDTPISVITEGDTPKVLFIDHKDIGKFLYSLIGQHLIRTAGEPSLKQVKWLHDVWKELGHSKGEHPLYPIVKAWIQTQLPSVEPERRTDTGILHHTLRDSYPSPRLPLELVSSTPRYEENMKLFSDLPQGGMQLTLPGFEFPGSELVPALPLVAYEGAGGKAFAPGRGAPVDQRLFINVLIEYMHRERGQYEIAQLKTNYRDVKSWLYPNGTTIPKSKLIPRLYEGLWKLHNLRFFWEGQEWNVISVPALPTLAIKPDDPLHFTVRLPPEINNKSGALIGIEPLRLYGAQSAPKFRAWVRLAYLWDKAKQLNGGHRIYATIPEVLRNADGYLVDAKGEVILTGDVYRTKAGWKCRNGQMPQTGWYHPQAIPTGRQVRNPQADKVPVLNDRDMVRLFFDHKERNGKVLRDCLSLARKHAEEMQKDGRVVVEQNQRNEKTDVKGWRILEPHLNSVILDA